MTTTEARDRRATNQHRAAYRAARPWSYSERGLRINPYPRIPYDYDDAIRAIHAAFADATPYTGNRSPFAGRNIITSEVVDLYRFGAYVVEISHGTGMTAGSRILGVTVSGPNGIDHKLSTCTNSIGHARAICANLAHN